MAKSVWDGTKWLSKRAMERRKRARSRSKPRKILPDIYVCHPPSADVVAYMASHGVTVREVPANERLGSR
jgi:hypothetical protein